MSHITYCIAAIVGSKALIKQRNTMNLSRVAWDSNIIDKIFLQPAIKKINEKLSTGEM